MKQVNIKLRPLFLTKSIVYLMTPVIQYFHVE